MSREVKRTIAQFLNGIALAILAAGVIGPLAMGKVALPIVAISLAMSLGLHVSAVLVTANGRHQR